MGAVPVAIPAGLFAPTGQRHPTGVLHRTARGALAPALDHWRSVRGLFHSAVADSTGVVVHVLHVPPGRLPALQRRRRTTDELAGVLHRPVHAMVRLRLRSGHAHPPPPVPGHPSLPAEGPSRIAPAGPLRLSSTGR